jgi:glucosamine-6-phosphate deaminase
MPDENIHFPLDLDAYSASFDQVRCLVMQGGQGEVKHWAFNDPPKREGEFQNAPPPPDKYLQLRSRITNLHPMTVIQNARTSGGGYVPQVPTTAATVGPVETWKSDCVSIWHPGHHDNPFGIRLTALMISKRIPDSSVPMSLLADHPCVKFSYFRGGIGTVEAEMH